MVNTTKGKNVTVEMYDAVQRQRIANGTRTKFGIPSPGVQTDVKYTRLYVNNEEAVPASVAPGAIAAITGNVTFTNGNAVVTGTTLDVQVAPGNQIRLDADGIWAEVETVDSATQITLTTVYSGTGGAAGAGSVRGAVVTLSSAPIANSEVSVLVPTLKNGAFSVQQDVRADVKTRTEDVKELGNDVITRDVVERAGTIAMTFAQAGNHNLMTKLSENSRNDTFMVIAVKYKNTTPNTFRVYKEVRVADLGAGATAGAVATETVTFNWVPPMEITTA